MEQSTYNNWNLLFKWLYFLAMIGIYVQLGRIVFWLMQITSYM